MGTPQVIVGWEKTQLGTPAQEVWLGLVYSEWEMEAACVGSELGHCYRIQGARTALSNRNII